MLKYNYMNIVKLVITSITYLLLGILEVYAYYLFRNDAIGIIAFFTLLGFAITFFSIVEND